MNTQVTKLHNAEEKEMKQTLINRNLENYKEYDATLFTFKFNGNLKTFEEIKKHTDQKIISTYTDYEKKIKLFDHDQEKVKVLLCSEAFARGNLRFAYKAKMFDKKTGNYEMFVAKNSIFKSDEKDKFEYNQQTILTQLVSKYLSEEFLKVSPSVKSIDFVDIKLIRIPEMGYYSIEKLIDGSFSKWSNNIGNLNENDYACTLDTFAHWTYEATHEYLIVTDLQGFRSSSNDKYILTDPAISCIARQFTDTDHGEKGISLYFRNHKCNHICQILNLKKHELQSGEIRDYNPKMTKTK
jgi:hypothetical protein